MVGVLVWGVMDGVLLSERGGNWLGVRVIFVCLLSSMVWGCDNKII